MKHLGLIFLLFSLTLSVSSFGADKLPQTIVIRRDPSGQIYVYKSDLPLPKIQQGNEAQLAQLEFVKLSEVANQVDINNGKPGIAELDNDKPRQSWYVFVGGPYRNYGYFYPSYPITYYAYQYNYVYYPYSTYVWGGSTYYWYVMQYGS
jgi:hypothetical protein